MSGEIVEDNGDCDDGAPLLDLPFYLLRAKSCLVDATLAAQNGCFKSKASIDPSSIVQHRLGVKLLGVGVAACIFVAQHNLNR